MSGTMALGTQASPAHSPGWARGLGALLALLGGLLVLLGTGVGSTGLENLWPLLWGGQGDAAERAMALQIVWDIRLPRTEGAWLAGAVLGVSGGVAQGVVCK